MKRLHVSFALGLIALVILTPTLAQTPSRGGNLRITIPSEPGTLDPHRSTAFLTRAIMMSVLESLYTLDAEGLATPDLVAEELISDDNLTYTLTIRDNVRFHNGEMLTADDVVASLERWFNISSPGSQFSPDIQSLQANNDLELEIRFRRNVGSLLVAALAQSNQNASIMPRSQIEAEGDDVIARPIGTGPFILAEVQPGQFIRLERYENFVSRDEPINGYGGGKTPYLDSVTFIPNPEATVRAAGVEAGDFDLAFDLPPDILPRFRDDPNLQVFTPYFGSLDFILNNRTGIFTDIRVRQAFLAALDMDLIMQGAYGDPALFRVEPSLWPIESAWYSEAGAELYNQNNPERAAELLAETGYNGEPIRWMTTRELPGWYESALIARQQLQDAGFNIELEVLDFATILSERFDDTRWEVFQTALSTRPDPIQYLLLDPEWPAFWDDSRKRELVEQLSEGLPYEERFAIWENLQTHYWEFVPGVKVGGYHNIYGASQRVQGYDESTQPFWYNVWVND